MNCIVTAGAIFTFLCEQHYNFSGPWRKHYTGLDMDLVWSKHGAKAGLFTNFLYFLLLMLIFYI